jgi:anti-anti-sigma factor
MILQWLALKYFRRTQASNDSEFLHDTAFTAFLFKLVQTCDDIAVETYESPVNLDEEIEMGIQNWSEDTIFIDLHREPTMRDELRTVTDIVHDRGDCNVILDFSAVDIITSSSLSALLKLRQSLTDNGHRLIFCDIQAFTKKAFEVTGLDGIFELADDKDVLFANLQSLEKGEPIPEKVRS